MRVKGYAHDKALKIITESLFESLVICTRAINHIVYIIRNEDVHLKLPRNRISKCRFFFPLKSFLCKEKSYWTPACDRLLLRLRLTFSLSFYHTNAYCHNNTFYLHLSFPFPKFKFEELQCNRRLNYLKKNKLISLFPFQCNHSLPYSAFDAYRQS